MEIVYKYSTYAVIAHKNVPTVCSNVALAIAVSMSICPLAIAFITLRRMSISASRAPAQWEALAENSQIFRISGMDFSMRSRMNIM